MADEKLKLYKYTHISTRSLSILSTGKAWYAKPKSFNDPFDCGVDICEDNSDDTKQILITSMENQGLSSEMIAGCLQNALTATGALTQTGKDIIGRMKAGIHQNRDNVGILSLSLTPENILMWSHYADQHKGMCIEFEVPVYPSLHEVTYPPKAPRFSLYDIFVNGQAGESLSLLKTKHEDWRYEKEYRQIVENGDNLYDIPGPITGVVFGLRTSAADESMVRKVAIGLDDEHFRRCHREGTQFGVVLKRA